MKKLFALSFLTATFLFGAVQPAHAEAESWYFNFALGYGLPQYPDDVDAAVDNLKAAGADNYPIAVDIGFYFPVGDGSVIIGPAINGLSDNYEFGGAELTVIKTGIYFSSMWTPGSEPGDGFFVRGDVGLPRIAVTSSLGDGNSDFGFGALIGAGYGISFGGTRLLLGASQAYSRVEGRSFGTTSFTVGGLF